MGIAYSTFACCHSRVSQWRRMVSLYIILLFRQGLSESSVLVTPHAVWWQEKWCWTVTKTTYSLLEEGIHSVYDWLSLPVLLDRSSHTQRPRPYQLTNVHRW